MSTFRLPVIAFTVECFPTVLNVTIVNVRLCLIVNSFIFARSTVDPLTR